MNGSIFTAKLCFIRDANATDAVVMYSRYFTSTSSAMAAIRRKTH